MAIKYDDIMQLKSEGQEFSYGDRETMLYALGVGFGRDPMNQKELPFVYEKELVTIPTMSSVIAWGAGNMAKSGINYAMVVHGEQKLTMHKPLPVAATIVVDSKVIGAWDKGEGKGAVIGSETNIRDKATGDALCTMVSTTFARGDGGFGGPKDGAPVPHAIPDRAPDQSFDATTEPGQALLYRLSGDRNPLHADPEFAKAVGFRPPSFTGYAPMAPAAGRSSPMCVTMTPSRLPALMSASHHLSIRGKRSPWIPGVMAMCCLSELM